MADHGKLLDQFSRRHQRLQPRASHYLFTFVLILGLLSSSGVQAVLTEDDIIDKELTWAAMARKKHQQGFYVGAHDRRGSTSKTWNGSDNSNRVHDDSDDWIQDDHANRVHEDNDDWIQDDHDRTRQQRQQDRIYLQLQHEEQLRQRQKIRRRRDVEMPSKRANLRGRSDAPLLR